MAGRSLDVLLGRYVLEVRRSEDELVPPYSGRVGGNPTSISSTICHPFGPRECLCTILVDLSDLSPLDIASLLCRHILQLLVFYAPNTWGYMLVGLERTWMSDHSNTTIADTL